MKEMDPLFKRALQSIADAKGIRFEDLRGYPDFDYRKTNRKRRENETHREIREKIAAVFGVPAELMKEHHYDSAGWVKDPNLRGKKEIVIEWEPIRYLPALHRMENISWMMYWIREEFKRLYQLEAELIQRELDNELLYGIHWKIRRPDLEQLYNGTL